MKIKKVKFARLLKCPIGSFLLHLVHRLLKNNKKKSVYFKY